MIRDFYIRLFLLSYTYNKNLLLQDFIIRDVDIRLTSNVVTAISRATVVVTVTIPTHAGSLLWDKQQARLQQYWQVL